MKLAVVIPVYNELELLPVLFERLTSTEPPPAPEYTGLERCERSLILVDDGSTDGSRDLVQRLAGDRTDTVAVLAHANRGKGSAVRLGLAKALELGADVAIIQDADLEYDPSDHNAVLAPILDGRADAVIGTRFMGQTHRVLYFWHQVANRAITLFSNMLSNLNLSDIECGFKAFGRPVLDRLDLVEDRFGVEPEIIARLSKLRLPDEDRPGDRRAARIYEVPVSYAGRTYAEGKKIGWADGFEALWCILRHNVFGSVRRD
ncbi:MAG: glycosyltransferase family 2 protein [Planctomycetota bacterium]